MKMTQEEFTIILPSNVENDMTSNTISHYRTQLQKRIILPSNENWKVCSKQITFKKSWYNIKEKFEIRFIVEGGYLIRPDVLKKIPIKNVKPDYRDIVCDDYYEKANDSKSTPMKIFTKPGYYENIIDLISELNSKISYFEDYFEEKPIILYDEPSRKVKIISGLFKKDDDSIQRVYPLFSDEIWYGLGFAKSEFYDTYLKIDGEKWPKINYDIVAESDISYTDFHVEDFNNEHKIAERVASLNDNTQSLLIYTDIIEQTLVGGTSHRILSTVPIRSSFEFDEVIDLNFQNPDFIPLQAKNFDTIEVAIKDDRGEDIDFKSGRVLIKLLFKKYE